MDFPSGSRHKPTISILSVESLGVAFRLLANATPSSGTWPVANKAIFVPFALAVPFRVQRAWWANGATASANVDCGVYTAGGALLGSVGSTVQAGTNVVQSAALSLLLTPGSYYLALVLSATTGTILRTTALNVAVGEPAVGMAQQTSAFPLPATVTLASASSASTPLFGITSSSVI